MNSISRLASVSLCAAGCVLSGVSVAAVARAEPRYHWCPGEQWSGWMGANWNGSYCHDNHYLDNVPHDREHWSGAGPFDPGFPEVPPGGYYPR